MELSTTKQYSVKKYSKTFKGWVRLSILIFFIICLISVVPFYFAGQQSSNLWNSVPFNPASFNSKNIVIPKQITEQPFIIGDTQTIKLANGENTFYLTINNKVNPQVGYFPFVYTLQTLSQDDKILKQETFRSYLLPNETKYIVASSKDPTSKTIRLIREPETKAINYNPNENQVLKQPNITIKRQNITPIAGTTNLSVNALFKNEDQIYVDKIDILYIIRDTRESVVGIGEYSFRGLFPNEEREFTLVYPQPIDRIAAQADVRWSFNYLDDSITRLI